VRYWKPLAIVGAVLLVMTGAAAWLAGTTSGLRFLAARAMPYLPASFDPAAMNGRLVGPLSIGRIELATDGVIGTIERVELDWRLRALLGRTLHLQDVYIGNPRFAFAAPRDPAEPEDLERGEFRLPLSIVIDRLVLQDGVFHYDDELVADDVQLQLAGRAGDDRIEITHLELHSNRVMLSGHALASLHSPTDPWDIDVEWRLPIEDHTLAGHTRITGQLAGFEVEQTLAGMLAGRIAGTISGLPETPAWDLAVALEPLPAGAGAWPEALHGFAARLQLEGRLEDNRIKGHLEVPEVLPGRIGIDAEGGWDDGIATLRRLGLTLADGARVVASGRIKPGEPLSAEFELEGEGLGWPLEGDREIELVRLSLRGSGADDRWQVTVDSRARREGLPDVDIEAVLAWTEPLLAIERLTVVSAEGEVDARASGVLDTSGDELRYQVALDADIRLPEQPPVEIRLRADGDTAGARIEDLQARLLDGSIEGAGRVSWAGQEAADFTLSFTGIDPAGLDPDFPGQLAGAVDLSGAPDGPDGLTIVLRALEGELRERPVRGQGELVVRGNAFELRSSTLSLGANTIEASGRIDEDALALDATLELASLADLDPAASGSLSAIARVSGRRLEPRIVLEASGSQLSWEAWRMSSLSLDMDVDLAGARPSRLLAELDGLADGPGPDASLRIEGDGLPRDHRARLQLVRPRPDQEVKLALEGGLEDARWTGRLTELSLADAQQELWSLQQPAGLELAADAAALSDACMDGTFGNLCLEANWRAGAAWGGRAALGELYLRPLTEWADTGLLADGVITGEIVVSADDDAFRGLSGGLALSSGDIRLAGENGGVLVAWQEGTLGFDGDPDEARIALIFALAGADRVEGRLTVGWNAPDPPLDGHVEAELAQLGIITEFVPDLANLEGRATLSASVSGTVQDPSITGRFEWLDGAAQVGALGINPTGINVVAEIVGTTLEFRAQGRSGDGEFETDGRFDLGAEAVEGRAALRGENVLVAVLPEARVTASPDIELSYSDRKMNVKGEVRIPFARITGLAGPTAVTASPDEVIIGPETTVAEEELLVTSRIRVTVGPDVQIQAAGLRGNVEGTILTVIQPRALPWGRGELRVVDGTFSAFGQRLEIETGRLIYTGGALENPGLEIRAVRRIDEITAGAVVRGTLQNPELDIFSDPAMARAEALSYLTLGKGLDELQAGERTTVNQAASSLALSGGGLIARDLGRRLGLDDVEVTADDTTGGAALVVGRHLGGGLYVSYGLGLFDTVNTLRLRYQINPRLSFEATSGEEVAADLFFTFERD
jgi:translocation and assembly module TamB